MELARSGHKPGRAFHAMHVKVIQKGGYAGQSFELAAFDTEKLSPEKKAQLNQLLQSPLWNSTPKAIGADMQQYEVWTVDNLAEQSRSFHYDGGAATQPLFDLVQKIIALPGA
jgi:hypothetical protein